MSTPLIAIVFLLFVGCISVVVLRFSAVISLMLKQQSTDRRELLKDIDLSHQRAHENAMQALGRIYERSHQDQIEMFNKTMDMVHGPQSSSQQAGDQAVDDPTLDNRPAWMPRDDQPNGGLIYADPTDDLLPDDQLHGPEDVQAFEQTGYAVSVRPGEGLL